MFNDLISPDKLILIGIFLLVGFPVHEFAHAFVAYRLGDPTAKLFGRLTLNPVAHFDPIGGAVFVLSVLTSGFAIGWAKPTPVNPSNLRDRRNSEVAVALAGPASNLVMACAAALAIRGIIALEVDVPAVIGQVLYSFVVFNVALTIFNLLPIPPLDGSSLLYRLISPQLAWQLRPILTQFGIVFVILFVFTFGRQIAVVMFSVTNFLVGR